MLARMDTKKITQQLDTLVEVGTVDFFSKNQIFIKLAVLPRSV